MILAAYLAGLSFLLALFAVTVAIAEHYRADRVEKAFMVSMDEARSQHLDLLESVTVLAASVKLATHQLVTQEQMIRAVAAASVPPVYPQSEKVHIVVPGPRTAQ